MVWILVKIVVYLGRRIWTSRLILKEFGENTWILSGAMILAHDHCRGLKIDTYIGDNCVIGVRSIILPGLCIGNQVVIGGGSVVTKNIQSHCIAAGNPAKVLKQDVNVRNGQIVTNG